MNKLRYIARQLLLMYFICIALANRADALSDAEAGYPFIQNFSPKEYGAGASNWCVLQDKRGVMYFGNMDGILEYDGNNWRLIEVPQPSFARSLAMDKNGRIYVAAVAEFGYLEADSNGKPVYKSLLSLLDGKHNQIGEVWDVLAAPEGIFFKTQNYLLRLRDGRIKIFEANGTFRIYQVNDQVYVRNSGVGLMKISGDSLELIPGGKRFSQTGVYDMLPYPDSGTAHGKILITTATDGLFLFDGKTVSPFRTSMDSFLLQNQLYHTALLSDSTYAIGTQRGGIIIMNHEGKLLKIVGKKAGLISKIIYYVYPDRDGGLWAALANGLARIETPSPLSLYPENLGITSVVNAISKHRGTLYIGDDYGVSYLSNSAGEGLPPDFTPVKGIEKPGYQFFSVDDRMMAVINNGVYLINENRTTRTILKMPCTSPSLFSPSNPNLVYINTIQGIAVVRKTGGRWEYAGHISDAEDYARGIAEEKAGVLWVVNSNMSISRIEFDVDADSVHRTSAVHTYFENSGFHFSQLLLLNNHISICTDKGLKRFDALNGLLAPDSSFGNLFAGSDCQIFEAVQGSKDRWYIRFERNKKIEIGTLQIRENGTVSWTPFPMMNRIDLELVTTIYPDHDPDTGQEILWTGTTEGLIRFDTGMQRNFRQDFPVHVRNVTVNQDSLIYGGGVSDSDVSANAPVLTFDNNSVNFSFAASSYDKPSATRYRTFLENFDKNWSDWSVRTRKDYTNLPPGEFRFRVQAKNAYNHISREAGFNFEVLPPWYRTWWAYFLYGLILVLGIITVDRIQRRRLTKKERERARVREIELHAKEAEARAAILQAENESKKNVELYSEIGKEITASLEFETIFLRLHEHLQHLARISIFEIGVYHPDQQCIEYKFSIKQNDRFSAYTIDTRNKNRLDVWCIDNQNPVFVDNFEKECNKYIKGCEQPGPGGLPAGNKQMKSIIYLPMIAHKKVLGVMGIQSSEANAYNEQHKHTLQNLAAYTAIALDNADTYRKLNATIEDLQSTQEKLITQEKLASLGALTAGIAHEIKNPLNFVNNFSELSVELVDELKEILDEHKDKFSAEEIENLEEILQNLNFNAAKVGEHGRRADNIVRSMLEHSRGKSDELREVNINAILEEDINLAYHGMRAQDSSFNVTIEKQLDPSIDKLPVIPQDISRVFLNIISNGFYAINSRKKDQPPGFKPAIRICTENLENHVRIRIRDNGSGIPKSVQDKLFTPFFTTKPSGQGTGLGLSLSYDIVVKEHHGSITFETEEGEFTEFIISLPKNGAQVKGPGSRG